MMATPRASCWTATLVDGPCGVDDRFSLPHCDGCARHPHSKLRDEFTGTEFVDAGAAALWAVRLCT